MVTVFSNEYQTNLSLLFYSKMKNNRIRRYLSVATFAQSIGKFFHLFIACCQQPKSDLIRDRSDMDSLIIINPITSNEDQYLSESATDHHCLPLPLCSRMRHFFDPERRVCQEFLNYFFKPKKKFADIYHYPRSKHRHLEVCNVTN